jgi:hypothetical protein
MTEIDDLELGRRLRALRVEPPDTGFEARLAESLLDVAVERPLDSPSPARVIVGPWLRRGPVRLIGATALLVAGAAAALDGGVVEWVQTRVLSSAPVEEPALPVSTPSKPRALERSQAHPARVPTPPETPELAAPAPSAATPATGAGPIDSAVAHAGAPRLRPERRERPRVQAAPLPEPHADPIAVPRVAIEPHAGERLEASEPRFERSAPGPASTLARERGRELERIRMIARSRRERAGVAERPRPIERVRERRERAAAERREIQAERGRRERPTR